MWSCVLWVGSALKNKQPNNKDGNLIGWSVFKRIHTPPKKTLPDFLFLFLARSEVRLEKFDKMILNSSLKTICKKIIKVQGLILPEI